MLAEILFDQFFDLSRRRVRSPDQTWFPANTCDTQLPAKYAVLERQTASVFKTTFDKPAFRLGRRNLMRPPLEMYDHPQDGAPGEAGDEDTAGLEHSHHFVKRDVRINEVFQHMGGHHQIKNPTTVREPAYVPLAKRHLETGIAKTLACLLEHTARYIDSVELERCR